MPDPRTVTTKVRLDKDGYCYRVQAGKAGWVEVSAYRDLNTLKIEEPTINCTATGGRSMEETEDFMRALKQAMKLAKQIKKKYTGA